MGIFDTIKRIFGFGTQPEPTKKEELPRIEEKDLPQTQTPEQTEPQQNEETLQTQVLDEPRERIIKKHTPRS